MLISAPSNAAADEVCTRLMQALRWKENSGHAKDALKSQYIRSNAQSRYLEETATEEVRYFSYRDSNGCFALPTDMSKCRLVVCTLCHAARVVGEEGKNKSRSSGSLAIFYILAHSHTNHLIYFFYPPNPGKIPRNLHEH